MSDILTLIATLTAKPDQSEKLGELLKAMVEPSRNESGCVTYNLHHSNDDPNAWVVYENWRSKEDLEIHKTLPHYLTLGAQAKDILAKEAEFHFLTPIAVPKL